MHTDAILLVHTWWRGLRFMLHCSAHVLSCNYTTALAGVTLLAFEQWVHRTTQVASCPTPNPLPLFSQVFLDRQYPQGSCPLAMPRRLPIRHPPPQAISSVPLFIPSEGLGPLTSLGTSVPWPRLRPWRYLPILLAAQDHQLPCRCPHSSSHWCCLPS